MVILFVTITLIGVYVRRLVLWLLRLEWSINMAFWVKLRLRLIYLPWMDVALPLRLIIAAFPDLASINI